jgi:hypothetical protein
LGKNINIKILSTEKHDKAGCGGALLLVPVFGRQRQENKNFKAIRNYIMNLRFTSVT